MARRVRSLDLRMEEAARRLDKLTLQKQIQLLREKVGKRRVKRRR